MRCSGGGKAAGNSGRAPGEYNGAVNDLERDLRRVVRGSVRFDPASRRFLSDQEADAMLKEKYRAPFVIPDRV